MDQDSASGTSNVIQQLLSSWEGTRESLAAEILKFSAPAKGQKTASTSQFASFNFNSETRSVPSDNIMDSDGPEQNVTAINNITDLHTHRDSAIFNKNPISMSAAGPSRQVDFGSRHENNWRQSSFPDRNRFPALLRQPTHAAFQTGAMNSLPSRQGVLSELRKLTAPYEPKIKSNQRRKRYQQEANKVKPYRPRGIEMFALASKAASKTPVNYMKQALGEIDLGHKFVEITSNLSSEQLENLIRKTYPKLGECPFELMKARHGGRGQPLESIVIGTLIPSVHEVLSIIKDTVCYIRPFNDIEFPMDLDDDIGVSTSDEWLPPAPIVLQSRSPRTRSQTATQPVYPVTVVTPMDSSQDIGIGRIVTDDMLTLEEIREKLYAEDPAVQEFAPNRENFLEWLLQTFKSDSFKILRKPSVEFPGEEGVDGGAPTREMFRLGFEALLGDFVRIGNTRVPLFEGSEGHKIPSSDIRLIVNGTFKAVGKFMAHAAIHVGIAFPGLSRAVVHYLCSTVSSVDDIPESLLSIEDLPDYELMVALFSMESWESMTESDKNTLEYAAAEAGYMDEISEPNKVDIIKKILFYNVILKRKCQLDTMKIAMRNMGLLNFLMTRSYLVSAVFPEAENLEVSKEAFLKSIKVNGDSGRILKILHDFILSSSDSEIVQKMLNSWTGWSFLPDRPIQLTIVSEGVFTVHSCSMEMVVPSEIEEETLKEYLGYLCQSGTSGFGAP